MTITATSPKDELLTAIDEPLSEMLELMSRLDTIEVNKVPYKDSWTAGMLFRHLSKSLKGMSRAMAKDAKPAERDPGERIPILKETFLDFSGKLKSPDFIVPEEGPYEKQAIQEELKNSFEELKASSANANLSELVKGLPLGDITKLEILHFVLYHMQRHQHQMKKISDALKNS